MDLFEDVDRFLDEENHFSTLTTIEEIRKQFLFADARLRDCYDIFSDYQKLLVTQLQDGLENPDDQLSFNFEGSDITMDEDGRISVDSNPGENDEEG